MKKNKYNKVILSIIIAFIVFLLNIWAFVSVQGIMDGNFTKGNSYYINNWKYIFSNNKPFLERETISWNQSNSEKPVNKSVLEFNKKYLRLQTTIQTDNIDKVLEFTTLNNPIKILINDNVVVDKGYDNQNYITNKVSTVNIAGNLVNPKIDVFMCVPGDFFLNARISQAKVNTTDDTIKNQIGYAIAIALAMVGVLLIILMFVFSLKNKGLKRGIVLASMMILAGTLTFLVNYSLHGTTFLGGVTFKVLSVLYPIILILFMSVINSMTKTKSLFSIINIVIFGVLTLAIIVLPTSALAFVLLLLFLTSISSLISIIKSIDHYNKTSPREFSIAFGIVSIFGFLCIAFDLSSLVLAINTNSISLLPLGIFLFSLTIYFIICNEAIFKNIRLVEREMQINRDANWLKATITYCSEIFYEKELRSFCTKTVKAIKALILFDNSLEGVDSSTLRINVAMINENNFDEIYNENGTDNCNYEKIIKHALNSQNKQLLFGNHCLDILLYLNENPLCIIHVEGIENALSKNFENIIYTAYSNISAALANTQLKMDMEETQRSVLIGLAEMVESKDSITGDHLKIVSSVVEAFCTELEMDKHSKDIVVMASMMHDLGKIAIPDTIISKTEKLTEEEREIMKQHVVFGYNILSKSNGSFMRIAAIIAQQHHEKYDGTGYLGIKGEQINIFARMVAVADVFDALLSIRSYKKPWSEQAVDEYINEQSGKQFDPQIVELFNNCKHKLFEMKRNSSKIGEMQVDIIEN